MKNNNQILLDGKSLTIEDLEVLNNINAPEVKISDASYKKMLAANSFVHEIVNRGEPVYGINTGF